MSPPKKKPGARTRPTTTRSTVRPSAARPGGTRAPAGTADEPSAKPSADSSADVSAKPSANAAAKPDSSADVSAEPSAKPQANASAEPSAKPDSSADVSAEPSANASAKPSADSSADVSAKPSAKPPARPLTKPSAKPPAKPPAKASAKPSAKASTNAAAGRPKAPTTAPTPALVVGAISPLTRLAGAVAVAAAALLLVQPAFPLVRDAGRGVGGAHNLWDFLVPLPAAAVVGVAGVLCLLGRLPRLGLAALIATGGYGLGQLLRTVALLDTRGHSSIDLPLPEGLVRSFRYAPGPGLVLQVVALAALTVVLVLALLAWRRTDMDDDGSFDPLRPTFAGLGFAAALVGFAGLAFPPAFPRPGGLTITVPALFDRSGLDLLGGWVLAAAVIAVAVGAATVRPRLAVVGMFAGLAAMFGTAALGNLLLVIRSTALDADTGTAFQIAAAVVFAALAVAAWQITWRPARGQD